MAMSVKVEFGNRSGETAAVEDAAASGDAGGNAVLSGGKGPSSCSVDDYFKIAKTSAFIIGGNFHRVALRFPDQLLGDAQNVLWTLRNRVQTLEAEKKKRGEGEGGRSARLIFIGSDTMDDTSWVDRVSEQRLQAAAVVDYGCARKVRPSVPFFYVFGRGDLDVEANAGPRGTHQASASNTPAIDFSSLLSFESFGDLLDTVTAVEEGGGARVWLPQKILAAPGSLGSYLDTDKLLQVCLDCVGSVEAENPPSMTTIAITAATEGGTQPSILLRTQRALLQATVGFLWRAPDHGGMVSASGLVVLPTARPSARYGSSASAGPRHPASPMSRREAPACGRETATKRSRVDSDEHGDKKMSNSGGSGPMRLGAPGVWRKARPGGGATGRPPKVLLTIVALPEQKARKLRMSRDTDHANDDEPKVYSQDEAKAMAARIILLERGMRPAAAATTTAVAGSSHSLGGGSTYHKSNAAKVQGYGESNGIGVQNYGAALSILGDAEIPQTPRHRQSSFSGLHVKNIDSSAGRSCPPDFRGDMPRDDGVPPGHHPNSKAQAFVYDACRRNGFNRHDVNLSGYTFHGDCRRQPKAMLDNFLYCGQPGHGDFHVGVGGWPRHSGTTPHAPSFGGNRLETRVFNGGREASKKAHASGSGDAAADHCVKVPAGTQDADEPLEDFRRCLGRLKPFKTLSNLRAWKRALDRLKATRHVQSRANITLTLNGDPKHGIQPVVQGCPMSTANRWAAYLRQVDVCEDRDCCKESELLANALKKHPALSKHAPQPS